MGWSNGFGLLSNNTDKPLHYRFLKKQRHRFNGWLSKSSRISNAPILDPTGFGWAQSIQPYWQEIRDEALSIYQYRDAIPPLREVSPDHRRLVEDNSWRSFFLIGYGIRLEANIARAPRTAQLIEQIPGLNSAFFSILAPGSVIVPHRGVTKAFITAHLGLSVPTDRDNMWMRVDKQKVHWGDGKWLIFDDTYEHEVRNDTNQTRIILLCQVQRPLKPPGNWLAAGAMGYIKRSHFVQDAKANLGDWEEVMAKAERETAYFCSHTKGPGS